MLPGNTGEHTENLRTSDADQQEEMVNTVDERLHNLAQITNPKDEDEEASELEEDSDLDENQEASEDDDEDSTHEAEDKDDDKDGDKDEDDMPDSYIQAALRSGWSQEDIDELAEANPGLAKKTFSNLYNSVNQASREYSALGRAKLQQNTVPVKQDDISDFEGVDVDKLKKEYEDNPIIDGVVKPLNDHLKKMHAELKTIKTVPQQNNNIDEFAIQQRVNGFFNADSMKPFEDFYGNGKSVEDLSYQQRKNRWDVLTEADAIIAGHEAIGKKIDTEEALIRAHMLVTEPIRERVIREKIKGDVKKRSKGITMRPSKSTKTSSGSEKFSGKKKPRNKQELVASVDSKLRDLFKE